MELLRKFWLFADLDEADIASLSGVAIPTQVGDGRVLFRKGDPTPGLHLVEAGAVKIYVLTTEGEERIVDIIGPGEFCGEMGVVDAAPSGAWGEAMGTTLLRVIPAQALEALLLANPALCLRLCRSVVSKLRAASRQLDETIFLGARERVLRQLMRLAERHGRPTEDGLRLTVRLTHQELAQMVGTARETVSRVLAELQERGLLCFERRQMLVPDLAALRRLTGEPTGGRVPAGLGTDQVK